MHYNDSGRAATMSRRRITLDLDEDILNAADRAAAERRQSRSQYIIESLQRALRQMERERIDVAFERMADDADYQSEMVLVEGEMSSASAAAWAVIESAERRAQ